MTLPVRLLDKIAREHTQPSAVCLDKQSVLHYPPGAGVAQGLCNGLGRDGPRFDFRWDGVKTELHVLRKGQ